jgi:hypothetical protein
MSESGETSLGVAGLLALPIVCCVGLPLLAGAGLSVAAAAWMGGLGLGALALAAVPAVIVWRGRRQRCHVLLSSEEREKHGR